MLAVHEAYHPDVIQGLVGLPTLQRRATRTALEQLLPNPMAHKGSTLTGDNFPISLGFTNADDTLRWTVDLCPSGSAQARRDRTLEVFQQLSGHKLCQAFASKRYGAWLGGRTAPDGALQYKLYVEPPEGLSANEGPLRDPAIAGFTRTLRMMGIGPGPTGLEYYYRFQNSSAYLLRKLLAAAHLEARYADILDLIETSACMTCANMLPGTRIGASFGYTGPDAQPVLTLYFFASAFWGAEGAIRRQALEKFRATPATFRAYAKASAPLAARMRPATYHDMVSLSVTNTKTFWGLGLRPIQTPARTAKI